MSAPGQHRVAPRPGDVVELRVWRFKPPRRLALATGSCLVPEMVPIAEEWALGWVYDVDEDGGRFEMRFEDEAAHGPPKVIRVADSEWRLARTR